MMLYHSSTVVVREPDLTHSRDFLDFGKGFYLTILKEQAVNYAERFIIRGKTAILNTYECNNDFSGLSVKCFSSYDEEWLDFICLCRIGKDNSQFDIVEGGIADDRIFRTIDLYFSGDLSKEEALKRLKKEEPNHQIYFRTEKALSFLKFKESTIL